MHCHNTRDKKAVGGASQELMSCIHGSHNTGDYRNPINFPNHIVLSRGTFRRVLKQIVLSEPFSL